MTTKSNTVTRVTTLGSSPAGVAAEMRVAAELCRFGFHVAQPYWTENEIDLLVAFETSGQVIFVPLQVKCVQFKTATESTQNPTYFIQNLKKCYVDGNKWLCLAIYNPHFDRFWFIDGAQNIRDAYNAQKDWRKHVPYDEIPSDGDVRIGLTKLGRGNFDKDWKCPENGAIFWDQRISRIAKRIADNREMVAEIKAAMGW